MIGDEMAPYFKSLGLDINVCPYTGRRLDPNTGDYLPEEPPKWVAGLEKFPKQLVEREIYPWEVSEDGEILE